MYVYMCNNIHTDMHIHIVYTLYTQRYTPRMYVCTLYGYRYVYEVAKKNQQVENDSNFIYIHGNASTVLTLDGAKTENQTKRHKESASRIGFSSLLLCFTIYRVRSH